MRLIDADALGNRMYHEVFEKDSEDQKWDSGCWMRYKLFERVLRDAPTIEPERQWIPCKDGEPEEYGEYRITWTTSVSKKRFIGDAEYVVSGEWDAKQDRFKGEWILDDYIENYPDVKVIAWKPLEEPYGEEGGE